MAVVTSITITHDKEINADVTALLKEETNRASLEANRIINFMAQLASGGRNGSVDVQIDGGDAVAASGTFTLASTVAANTCSINGVTFTCVASGATGNQFNVGVSDSATATNLANAISGSVTSLIAGYVTASAVGAVVTVTAAAKGITGNTITITGGTNITASGARLTGGTAPTANTYKFGV